MRSDVHCYTRRGKAAIACRKVSFVSAFFATNILCNQHSLQSTFLSIKPAFEQQFSVWRKAVQAEEMP
ncbi:MAG TPA: hypothetical protein V6C65_13270, partial [Allocoleopsis sp.]